MYVYMYTGNTKFADKEINLYVCISLYYFMISFEVHVENVIVE